MHQRAVPETGRVFGGSFSRVVKESRESGGARGGVVGVVDLSSHPQAMQEHAELARDGDARSGPIALTSAASDARPVAFQIARRLRLPEHISCGADQEFPQFAIPSFADSQLRIPVTRLEAARH